MFVGSIGLVGCGADAPVLGSTLKGNHVLPEEITQKTTHSLIYMCGFYKNRRIFYTALKTCLNPDTLIVECVAND